MDAHAQQTLLYPHLRDFHSGVLYHGINRRTSALLPNEQFSDASLLLTSKMTILQRLLNIEATRLTCCVKIEAPRFKSRTGLLIVRGKVLACVYSSKSLPSALFGRVAFDRFMSEMPCPENTFHGYGLPEEVALAAGSIFHNQIVPDAYSGPHVEMLYSLLEQFDKGSAPGAIALFDESDRPLCLALFYKRELLGTQSFFGGTAFHNFSQLMDHLRLNRFAQVRGSMLNLSRSKFAKNITFSLSGLEDRKDVFFSAKEIFVETAGLVIRQAVKPHDRPLRSPASRFVNAHRVRCALHLPMR